MSRSTDERDNAGRLGRPAGLPKRWSARRKAEVVLANGLAFMRGVSRCPASLPLALLLTTAGCDLLEPNQEAELLLVVTTGYFDSVPDTVRLERDQMLRFWWQGFAEPGWSDRAPPDPKPRSRGRALYRPVPSASLGAAAAELSAEEPDERFSDAGTGLT